MNRYIGAIFIVFYSIANHSCPSLINQFSLKLSGVGLGGYWELSETYYPKTVAYFYDLQEKYPALNSVEILILDGPMADNDTIYFTMAWIEELEKGNKFYREMTEWILLHEMGHIAHRDVFKKIAAFWMVFVGYMIQRKYNNAIRYSYFYTIEQYQELVQGAFWGNLVQIAGLAKTVYNMATIEYYADDYAMQHCDNPQAWIAAYEFLDRKAPLGVLPGVFHSFTKYRLSRISKAFKKKFGYELVVIPQSLCPEYIA